MTDLTSASPIASTVPADRTPGATTGTPLTFRTVRQRWTPLILLAVLVPLVLGALAMVDGGRLLVEAWLHRSARDDRSPCSRRAKLIPEVGPVIPALQPITRSDDRARIGGPARTGGRSA
jgi:hypothetical protein